MPQEASKLSDSAADAEAVAEVVEGQDSGESEDENAPAVPENATAEGAAAGAAKKKKKNKKKRIKAALTGQKEGEGAEDGGKGKEKEGTQKITRAQLEQMAAFNPTLKNELKGADDAKIQDMLKNLSIGDLLTGASVSGKNRKDMSSYKFWQTQPVPRFDENRKDITDGPIENVEPSSVPKTPAHLPEGFEWVTMNLEDEKELHELYALLSEHYVEDGEQMFRFHYSDAFLNWALKAPGWRKEWHVGVRAKQSQKLVAFISAVPVDLRIRKNVVKCSEVNYLCVHKKLRAKRLTPVLIREITRRSNEFGIFQAVYTVGVILPTPVSTCRYFHRALDWEKLYEVGFSGLPPGSTVQRQVMRNKLPKSTATPGLRPMEKKDAADVLDLLKRYLARVDMAQVFTQEEVEHWMLQQYNADSQVVWSYVVEDPNSHKITDFFSFYSLESTAIGNAKHPLVRAAYLFYYATETVFDKDKKAYKARLNALMNDALILAKKAQFDVFNALTLLDNPMFLEDQKFGAGDGSLHYYLFNYRAATVKGGIDANNKVDEKSMGGVGLVML